MRALALLALAVLAAGCGSDDGAPAGPTELTVAYREDAARPETEETWTLACDAPSGSHPDPPAACGRLAEVGPEAFAPPPSDRACAEIWGGPQRAVVTGTVAGVEVGATFQRRNGCEIEDWDRLLGLLPPGGA